MFFFKQKTAYEMRISDWSSDVCSSDLPHMIRETIVTTRSVDGSTQIVPLGVREQGEFLVLAPFKPSTTLENLLRERCAVINYTDDEIGRASCRERVCQSV